MAEKLCRQFGAGPHTLKIGKSFENNKGGSKYHSIRYDFKPNSIDEERMGSLEVKERQGVSVQLPHSDGVGQTLYKGNAETAPTKDCVLIIDHETGELTLERISNKIMVKKTRQEKAEKGGGGGGYEVKPHEPSNPYEVKVPEAANPYAVKPPENSNPYAVKPPEATNPYAVKAPEGAKPYVARPPKTTKQAKQQRTSNSSARPHTPQQPQDKYQPPPVNPLKKRSPVHPELAPCLSPHHSNKSSPASTSGRGPSGQGYNFDSLGRPLSSSDSSSDSGSDSDTEDPPPPAKPAPAPPKAALPPPKTSKTPQDSPDFGGLGTLDDLLGAAPPPPPAPTRPGGGTLATAARPPPGSKHSSSSNASRNSSKTSSRAPQGPPPSMPGSFSDPDDPDDPPPPSMAPSMPPYMAPSMPSSIAPSMPAAPPTSMPSVFDALGDDLELSDDSD